jgi:prepilin-type N-terminal cleavage/methylation domain-containing protein
MNVQRKEKGFTIIEVVLVLAIAGLIFLMVFIALPALQRSQRDTQRKSDLARLETAVSNYQSNNRGTLPALPGNPLFTTTYLAIGGSTFADPTGADYTLTKSTVAVGTAQTATFDSTTPTIFFTAGATCGTDADTTAAGSVRNEAFQMALENGGYACDNV